MPFIYLHMVLHLKHGCEILVNRCPSYYQLLTLTWIVELMFTFILTMASLIVHSAMTGERIISLCVCIIYSRPIHMTPLPSPIQVYFTPRGRSRFIHGWEFYSDEGISYSIIDINLL